MDNHCLVCGLLAPAGRATCSEECHEEFVGLLIERFGEYKRVVDLKTGIEYKVPTRYIVEHGLKTSELPQFPRWEE